MTHHSSVVRITLDISPSRFREKLFYALRSFTVFPVSAILSTELVSEFHENLKPLENAGKLRFNKPNIWGTHHRQFQCLRELLQESSISLNASEISLSIPKELIAEFAPPKHVHFGTQNKITFVDNWNYWWQKDLSIRKKELKTVNKYILRFSQASLKSDYVESVYRSFAQPCECPLDVLQPVINYWEWNVRFHCKLCGKVFLCECFRKALKKAYPHAKEDLSQYLESTFSEGLYSSDTRVAFRNGICHVCREVPSDLAYCNEMYRNKFIVRYGPYVVKMATERDISMREAEDELRDRLGIPRGLNWISEVELYKIVKELLPNKKVVHQGRPKWLGSQFFDVWIPDLNLAIEYQGTQHYQPVEFFGGEEGLRNTKARDKRKAGLCQQNKVELVYFRYDEEINKIMVMQRLKPYLNA